LVAALERFQYALRQTESSRWWASNGRDVLNLFSLGVVTYGLILLGFYGALVFLIGASLVVVLTALQSTLARGPSRGVLSFALAFAVGLPALAWPKGLAWAAKAALQYLAP
jgi:hypothetical protein